MLFSLAVAVMLCALCPAVLFCINLRRYREPRAAGAPGLPSVSVLIPARNEERAIGALVESVLLSRGVEFEVIVMDDGSTDRTSAIVRKIAERDARVRLEGAPALGSGWNGKQHACWHLARAAANDVLCFVDADVRLEPEAIARMAAFLHGNDAALVSGFPRQVTETWLEWILSSSDPLCAVGISADGRDAPGDGPLVCSGVRAVHDGGTYCLLCSRGTLRDSRDDA